MPTDSDIFFAKEAAKSGFITREQVAECLKLLKEAEQQGTAVQLADVLLEKGYLTAVQCEQVRNALGEDTAQRRKINQLGDFRITRRLGLRVQGYTAEVNRPCRQQMNPLLCVQFGNRLPQGCTL